MHHTKYQLHLKRRDMAAMGEDGQIAQPAIIEGRNMIILYGTETGNSEEIASELGQMAQRLHFRTDVDDMDRFKLVCACQHSASFQT